MIDRPPPLGNMTLPVAFEEHCEDCLIGGLASPAHKCIGKWMAELAYRSCHYKRNCLCGLLDALRDTRNQEVGKGHELSVEIVDLYIRELSRKSKLWIDTCCSLSNAGCCRRDLRCATTYWNFGRPLIWHRVIF